MAEHLQVADLFARLGLEVDLPEWEKGEHKIHGVAGSLKELGKMSLYAGAALAAIATGVAYKVGEWFEEIGEKADKMSKDAQKIGVSTEALEKLAYAAGLSDVSVESLSHSVGHFSRELSEGLKKGTGAAVEALNQMHIPLALVKGKGIDEILPLIAEKFEAMPNGIEKTALAMQLFGRGGKELIPLLNGGKKELNELMKEAEELGIVVSGPTAKAFEKFNDDAKRVKTAWEGVKTQIAVALLPHLQRVIDGVLGWVKANHELIQQKVEEAIEKVTEVATDLYHFLERNWPTIKELFSTWGETIKNLAKDFAGLVDAITYFITRLKQIKTWLQPVFDWIEDKLKKIGAAIAFVVDKIPGMGGGKDGEDSQGVRAGKWIGKRILGGPVLGAYENIKGLFGSNDTTPKSEGIPGVTSPTAPTIGAGAPGPAMFGSPAGGASNSFTAQIVVNASPGMNEKELAEKTVKLFDEYWDGKIRQAAGDLT